MGELYLRAGQRDDAYHAWNDLLTLWRNAEAPLHAKLRKSRNYCERVDAV